jgi:hypothetical protein
MQEEATVKLMLHMNGSKAGYDVDDLEAKKQA